MLGHRFSVLLITCTCTLYSGQTGRMGVAGYTEQALSVVAHLTGRLAMRSFGFTMNYPRLTFTLATVTPMVFPRYRYFVRRQAKSIIGNVTARFGKWLQHNLQEWLLKPFNDKLDVATQGLDEQYQILHDHTNQLTDVQDRIGHVYDDTQSLVKGHTLLFEKVSRLEELFSEHGQQHNLISDRIDQGKAETLDKIGLLEQRLEQLSDDQKKLFKDYGTEFSGRFDELSEHLRIVLESMAARHVVACRQQYRLEVAQ